MRRCGTEYDRLDKLAIEIYLDYGFNSFPLDVKDVCRRMGLSLVPYSEYTGEERELLHKESQYDFFAPRTKESAPTIFYNDDPGVPPTAAEQQMIKKIKKEFHLK